MHMLKPKSYASSHEMSKILIIFWNVLCIFHITFVQSYCLQHKETDMNETYVRCVTCTCTDFFKLPVCGWLVGNSTDRILTETQWCMQDTGRHPDLLAGCCSYQCCPFWSQSVDFVADTILILTGVWSMLASGIDDSKKIRIHYDRWFWETTTVSKARREY